MPANDNASIVEPDWRLSVADVDRPSSTLRRGNDAGPRSWSYSSHDVEIGPGAFDHCHLTFLQVGWSGNAVERVAMASDAEVGP